MLKEKETLQPRILYPEEIVTLKNEDKDIFRQKKKKLEKFITSKRITRNVKEFFQVEGKQYQMETGNHTKK